MKIGIIDLDTSHPEAWLPFYHGHEVVSVYDGGSVHPPGEADAFAARHGIAHVATAVEEMVEKVDAVILHGCDWSTHVAKARPFIEAGKAVLIDKPVAGNAADLRQIEAWAAAGARITGGSVLRFCREWTQWKANHLAERGTPHTVFTGCGVDEFNYGIHAYSFLCEIMGEGAASVRHLHRGAQRTLEVRWDDGRLGLVTIGAVEKWLPFHATVITEKSVQQFQPDPLRLYEAFLERVLPYLAGESDEAPLTPSALVEAERLALAAKTSWEEGNREVSLQEIRERNAEGYDGPAFARQYRAARAAALAAK